MKMKNFISITLATFLITLVPTTTFAVVVLPDQMTPKTIVEGINQGFRLTNNKQNILIKIKNSKGVSDYKLPSGFLIYNNNNNVIGAIHNNNITKRLNKLKNLVKVGREVKIYSVNNTVSLKLK